MNWFKKYWGREGGYKDILSIAWPLILSTSSITIQQFVDRVFLARHSAEELAAAVPAGALSWVIIGFFIGITSYIGTFVAQYNGAERKEKIPICITQGIYLSIIFSCICLLVIPFADTIFKLTGHGIVLAEMEKKYFLIMIYFSFISIVSCAFSSFFIGLGKTQVMLWITLVTTVINIILDWIMIFGKFGCPEMGIAGAAYATQIACFVGLLIFIVIYFNDRNRKEYHTHKHWKIDFSMIGRIFKFGYPNGIQCLLEGAIWTLFILLVGRISMEDLAATNIAWQVNAVAFMPIFGIATAVSVLVARELGKNCIQTLGTTIKSSLHIAILYNALMAILYVVTPMLFINLFMKDIDTVSQANIVKLSKMLLRFLAVYVIVDSIGIILGSVLRGAGDTLFVMLSAVICGFVIVVAPTYYFCQWKVDNALAYSWVTVVIFVFTITSIFAFRVKQGKWKNMRIIEPEITE